MEARHESVLAREVLDALDVRPSDMVIDATIGGAGHFALLLAALGENGMLVGVDADPEAVERARRVYALDRRPERPVAHLVNDNFRNLRRILDRLGIVTADKILFDLGWSGYQIAAARGFSFTRDEPLLMTYGLPAQAGEGAETAAEIVNTLPENELARIILAFGEERFARGIARSIVLARSKERILTTGALVRAVEAGIPAHYRRQKIHPATKTFQALRIAVNDELAALHDGIRSGLAALSPKGRLAIISFHSLEDRIVKNLFRGAARAGLGFFVSKKPIVPSPAEVKRNRSARSAKLRVFERSIALPLLALEADRVETPHA